MVGFGLQTFAKGAGRRRLAGISRWAEASGGGGPFQQLSDSKRRRVIAGNWKMFKTPAETRAFFGAFNPLVAGVTDCDILIAPPAIDIPTAVESSKGTHIAIASQNIHWEK